MLLAINIMPSKPLRGAAASYPTASCALALASTGSSSLFRKLLESMVIGSCANREEEPVFPPDSVQSSDFLSNSQ